MLLSSLPHMSPFRGRVRKRSKLAAVVIVIVILLMFVKRDRAGPIPAPHVDLNFDVMENRQAYVNPVFENLDTDSPDIKVVCSNYFSRMLELKTMASLEKLVEYDPGQLIFKKKQWILNLKKYYRRQLRKQGITIDDSHVEELYKRYAMAAMEYSEFEFSFISQIAHLRVFGKCIEQLDDVMCTAVSRELIPWLSGNPADFESKETPKCVWKQVLQTTGRGIVIPLDSEKNKHQELLKISRLIQVLRGNQNQLPIEVVLCQKHSLNSLEKSLILNSAREKEGLPEQKVRFINVFPTIRENVKYSRQMLLSLALLFSSFEDPLLVGPSTIPLANLAVLYDDQGFQDTGLFFFKTRAALEYKPLTLDSGFYESNELFNLAAIPLKKEQEVFNIQETDPLETLWSRSDGFLRLIDPSVILVNKPKTLTGLLIGSILPLHKVLEPKYDFSDFNPDVIWLGLDLGGIPSNFKHSFAGVAGLLTPPERLDDNGYYHEICSSSLAQFYGPQDKSLLYVTAEQLENTELPSFLNFIRKKYRTAAFGKSDLSKSEMAEVEAAKKIEQNALYIAHAILPVPVKEPFPNNEGLPFLSWKRHLHFGGSPNYWCGFDIHGSLDSQNRGLVYHYTDEDIQNFESIISTWLEQPEQGDPRSLAADDMRAKNLLNR